jgi:hypothetical protein
MGAEEWIVRRKVKVKAPYHAAAAVATIIEL